MEYLSGFGNDFESEAVAGALPRDRINPQKCPLGLYAEQLSGTAFTCPRPTNQRSWFYRIRPSVTHTPFVPAAPGLCGLRKASAGSGVTDPNQLRWHPKEFPAAGERVNWIQGLSTMCFHGDPCAKSGIAVHMYSCNADMENTALCNADGDFLIVPQENTLLVTTEFGKMRVEPTEICVVQRGIVMSVALEDRDCNARGYVLEVYDGHFTLPDNGPLGINSLALPRDFLTPVAAFEDRDCAFTVVQKYGGEFFTRELTHSPFNVVAWHGNYAPYKYDLKLFSPVNSVFKDHPDPSIFTVLTCQSNTPGVAVADFVIFPPRWMVAEDTFRPPWYHRNTMTEFMGLITGAYDAKKAGKGGFNPGGASLHSCMSAHGPEAGVFEAASNVELQPHFLGQGSLAFMFETSFIMKLSEEAMAPEGIDGDYYKCWEGLQAHFRGQEPLGL